MGEKVYKIWLDDSVGKQTQQQLSIKYDYSPRTIRQYWEKDAKSILNPLKNKSLKKQKPIFW